jgi:hypothetical protein
MLLSRQNHFETAKDFRALCNRSSQARSAASSCKAYLANSAPRPAMIRQLAPRQLHLRNLWARSLRWTRAGQDGWPAGQNKDRRSILREVIATAVRRRPNWMPQITLAYPCSRTPVVSLDELLPAAAPLSFHSMSFSLPTTLRLLSRPMVQLSLLAGPSTLMTPVWMRPR